MAVKTGSTRSFRGFATMADQGDMDIKAHEATYRGVMSLLKWGTVASFAIAAIVVLIIAS